MDSKTAAVGCAVAVQRAGVVALASAWSFPPTSTTAVLVVRPAQKANFALAVSASHVLRHAMARRAGMMGAAGVVDRAVRELHASTVSAMPALQIV